MDILKEQILRAKELMGIINEQKTYGNAPDRVNVDTSDTQLWTNCLLKIMKAEVSGDKSSSWWNGVWNDTSQTQEQQGYGKLENGEYYDIKAYKDEEYGDFYGLEPTSFIQRRKNILNKMNNTIPQPCIDVIPIIVEVRTQITKSPNFGKKGEKLLDECSEATKSFWWGTEEEGKIDEYQKYGNSYFLRNMLHSNAKAIMECTGKEMVYTDETQDDN